MEEKQIESERSKTTEPEAKEAKNNRVRNKENGRDNNGKTGHGQAERNRTYKDRAGKDGEYSEKRNNLRKTVTVLEQMQKNHRFDSWISGKTKEKAYKYPVNIPGIL